MLRNTESKYGWLAILLHWLIALAIFCMFGLGLWMEDMEYYDSWYRTAPYLHKSFGLLIFALMAFRLAWRATNVQPTVNTGSKAEKVAAKLAHGAFYLLIALITVSGYMISTADGRPIEFFSLFDVPAVTFGIENQEDLAGEIHEIVTKITVILGILHGLAALKHHFYNKDNTLKKMLGKP